MASSSKSSPHRSVQWLPGLTMAVFVAATACVVLCLAALVVFVRPTVAGARDQTTVTVGGLHYSVNNAWVLDPRRRVDAAVAEGLPRRDRKLPADELLYAVFVGVTNETDTPRPMASQIALRDTRNIEYRLAALAAENEYAYRPVVLRGKSHLPAPSSPAASDMSAEGMMLLFRIPRRSYRDGPLELVLHDPGHPSSVATVQTA
jgi:hypothetical protein